MILYIYLAISILVIIISSFVFGAIGLQDRNLRVFDPEIIVQIGLASLAAGMLWPLLLIIVIIGLIGRLPAILLDTAKWREK